jgi:hypothetical protein
MLYDAVARCRVWRGDAGADQGLVADEPEGKADQDWREGREPRPLHRLPDGRGRHPTAKCSRRFYASSQNYGRSHHQRQRETFDNHVFKGNRQEECAQMQKKRPDQPIDHRSGWPEGWQPPEPSIGLARSPITARIFTSGRESSGESGFDARVAGLGQLRTRFGVNVRHGVGNMMELAKSKNDIPLLGTSQKISR